MANENINSIAIDEYITDGDEKKKLQGDSGSPSQKNTSLSQSNFGTKNFDYNSLDVEEKQVYDTYLKPEGLKAYEYVNDPQNKKRYNDILSVPQNSLDEETLLFRNTYIENKQKAGITKRELNDYKLKYIQDNKDRYSNLLSTAGNKRTQDDISFMRQYATYKMDTGVADQEKKERIEKNVNLTPKDKKYWQDKELQKQAKIDEHNSNVKLLYDLEVNERANFLKDIKAGYELQKENIGDEIWGGVGSASFKDYYDQHGYKPQLKGYEYESQLDRILNTNPKFKNLPQHEKDAIKGDAMWMDWDENHIKDDPIGSLEYITKKGYNESIIGLADKIFADSKIGYIDPRALATRETSWLEDAAGSALGLVLDGAVGGFGGGTVGKNAVNGITRQVLKDEVTSLMAKGLVKKEAEKIVLAGAQKQLAYRLSQGAAQGATSLGLYGGGKDFLSQLSNPDVDLGDIDYGHVLSTAGKDALLGLTTGFIGAGTNELSRLSQNFGTNTSDFTKTLTKIGINTGGFTAENAAFIYGGAALDGRGLDEVTAEDWASSAALLGMLKVKHIGNQFKNFRQSDNFVAKSDAFSPEFTDRELQLLGQKDSNETIDYFLNNETELSNVLQSKDIPYLTKAKLLWATNGVQIEKNFMPDKVVVNEKDNGEVTLDLVKNDGTLIDSRNYDNAIEAKRDAVEYATRLSDNKYKLEAENFSVDEQTKLINNLGWDLKTKEQFKNARDKALDQRTEDDIKLINEFNKEVDNIIKEREVINAKGIGTQIDEGSRQVAPIEETEGGLRLRNPEENRMEAQQGEIERYSVGENLNYINDWLNEAKSDIVGVEPEEIKGLVRDFTKTQTPKNLEKVREFIDNTNNNVDYAKQFIETNNLKKGLTDKINKADFAKTETTDYIDLASKLQNVDLLDLDVDLLNEYNSVLKNINRKVPDVSGMSEFYNKYQNKIENEIDRRYDADKVDLSYENIRGKIDDLTQSVRTVNEINERITNGEITFDSNEKVFKNSNGEIEGKYDNYINDYINFSGDTKRQVINIKTKFGRITNKIEDMLRKEGIEYVDGKFIKGGQEVLTDLVDTYNDLKGIDTVEGLAKILQDNKILDWKQEELDNIESNFIKEQTNLASNNIGQIDNKLFTKPQQNTLFDLKVLVKDQNVLDKLSVSDADLLNQVSEQLLKGNIPSQTYDLINTMQGIKKVNALKPIFDKIKNNATKYFEVRNKLIEKNKVSVGDLLKGKSLIYKSTRSQADIQKNLSKLTGELWDHVYNLVENGASIKHPLYAGLLRDLDAGMNKAEIESSKDFNKYIDATVKDSKLAKLLRSKEGNLSKTKVSIILSHIDNLMNNPLGLRIEKSGDKFNVYSPNKSGKYVRATYKDGNEVSFDKLEDAQEFITVGQGHSKLLLDKEIEDKLDVFHDVNYGANKYKRNNAKVESNTNDDAKTKHNFDLAYGSLLKSNIDPTKDINVKLPNTKEEALKLLDSNELRLAGEIRKLLDEKTDLVANEAQKNGVKFVRRNDYFPYMNADADMDYGNTVQDLLGNYGKNLNLKTGSIIERNNSRHYTSYDLDRIMGGYFNNLNRSMYVDSPYKQTQQGLSNLEKQYIKDKETDSNIRSIIGSLKNEIRERTARSVGQLDRNVGIDTRKAIIKASRNIARTALKTKLFSIAKPPIEAVSNIIRNPIATFKGAKAKLSESDSDIQKFMNEQSLWFSGNYGGRDYGESVKGYGTQAEKIANDYMKLADSVVGSNVYYSKYIDNFKKITGEDFNLKKWNSDEDYRIKNWDANLAADSDARVEVSKTLRNPNTFNQPTKYDVPLVPFMYNVTIDTKSPLGKTMSVLQNFNIHENMYAIQTLGKDMLLNRNKGTAQSAMGIGKVLMSNVAYMTGIGTAYALRKMAVAKASGDEEQYDKALNQLKDNYTVEGLGEQILANGTSLLTSKYGNISRTMMNLAAGIAVNSSLEGLNSYEKSQKIKEIKEKYKQYSNTLFLDPIIMDEQKATGQVIEQLASNVFPIIGEYVIEYGKAGYNSVEELEKLKQNIDNGKASMEDVNYYQFIKLASMTMNLAAKYIGMKDIDQMIDAEVRKLDKENKYVNWDIKDHLDRNAPVEDYVKSKLDNYDKPDATPNDKNAKSIQWAKEYAIAQRYGFKNKIINTLSNDNVKVKDKVDLLEKEFKILGANEFMNRYMKDVETSIARPMGVIELLPEEPSDFREKIEKEIPAILTNEVTNQFLKRIGYNFNYDEGFYKE